MKRIAAILCSAFGLAVGAYAPALAIERTMIVQGMPNPKAFPDGPVINNPYLPMMPGTTFVYDGTLGNHAEHNPVVITNQVKTIIGIPCIVVRDTGFLDGIIEELTFDYFAQDFYGNVWYFGEYTTQYKNGQPTGHVGSWLAGVHGAQPGVIMEATPRVGDHYVQENAPPVAKDEATVLSLTASVSTPYGNFFGNVLQTKEYSGIGQRSPEYKWYEPGIGFMKNEDVTGHPREILVLTAINHR